MTASARRGCSAGYIKGSGGADRRDQRHDLRVFRCLAAAARATTTPRIGTGPPATRTADDDVFRLHHFALNCTMLVLIPAVIVICFFARLAAPHVGPASKRRLLTMSRPIITFVWFCCRPKSPPALPADQPAAAAPTKTETSVVTTQLMRAARKPHRRPAGAYMRGIAVRLCSGAYDASIVHHRCFAPILSPRRRVHRRCRHPLHRDRRVRRQGGGSAAQQRGGGRHSEPQRDGKPAAGHVPGAVDGAGLQHRSAQSALSVGTGRAD